MTTGVIDQSGGTLAWSELPNGNRQLTQKYDTREQWIISANPTSGIDAVRVICHETGHALGVGHIQSGNLLAPVYSRQIRKPQSGDVQEMRERYGPPVTGGGTEPTPQPTPGGGSMFGDLFKKLFSAIFAALGPKLIEMLGPLIIKWLEDWINKNANLVSAAGLDAGKFAVVLGKLKDDLKADMQALSAQALTDLQAIKAP